MLLEQLIFIILSFAIFVYIFLRMIKRNDTTYVILLVMEALGIALNFAEVLFSVKLNFPLLVLKYVLAIILPILIIILEKRVMTLNEFICITKANLSLMIGNKKLAKQALIKLLEKNPKSYKAHKMLAQIYENEGGMRKAIDEYVQAIDIDKKDYDSYYKIAELLNGLDKKEEASQMLFNLLNKKPEMLEATILLGEILIEQEKYKEAVNVYQDALKYDSINYDINYNLGIAYTMLNDFQSAKICYEKAANINSLLYNANYCLAEIALIYKDLEEAERKFLQSIESEELSADAYFELSKIYLIKGDKETALKYINIAIDENSKIIVEKVKKEPLFIPIMAKISIPFNLEEKNHENKNDELKLKEIRAKDHLEQMCEITRHLSYNDINLLKHNKTKESDSQLEDKEKKNFKERYQ